jgi:hypothetical protein
MPCRLCQSANLQLFPTEIAFHAPPGAPLSLPHLLLFPQVLVCFNCGFAEFSISKEMLHELPAGNSQIIESGNDDAA